MAIPRLKNWGSSDKYSHPWQNTVGDFGNSSSSSSTSNFSMDNILEKYQQEWDAAKQANEQRYQQGMSILDNAVKRYQPGGDFGKGAMSQYNIGKTQAMSEGMSSLVGSGLSNTTVAATMPIKYEQEVGTPFRLQLNDMRMQNLTQAEQAKASWIQEREDMYPDLGMMSQLAMQAQQAQDGGGGQSHTTTIGEMSGFGDEGWHSPQAAAQRSASNYADKMIQEAKDAETSASNAAKTQSLASAQAAIAAKTKAAMTPEGQAKKMGTPLSDQEYKALLAQNMGTSTMTYDQPDPAITGPFQPKSSTTQKKNTNNWLDNLNMDFLMGG